MTSRRIHTATADVPPLSLPPGALSGIDDAYDYDVDRDPPAIEPIEHRIRLDFMAGGPIRHDELLDKYNPWSEGPDDPDPWGSVGKAKPQGLRYAEASCQRTLAQEASYYQHFEDDVALENAPEFLAHRLRACRDADNPGAALREERERRENWYESIIPWKNLYHVLKRSTYGSLVETPIGTGVTAESLLDQNAFVGMVIIGADENPDAFASTYDLPAQYVIPEGKLSSVQNDISPTLTDYGIELPAPLLVGEYASGSQYPLLPWTDALVCSCPYKHDKPWRVICKHELLACIVAGSRDSIFLPVTRGIEVPHRARRFVAPELASRHTPRLQAGENGTSRR